MGLIDVLSELGFDSSLAELDSGGKSKVKMARHKDTRPVVEWDKLINSPEQFEEYQSWQANPVFHGLEYLVSFIGDSPGRATFWGVYQVLGVTEVPHEELPEPEFWPFKEGTHYRYELKRVPSYDLLKGLVIEWNNAIVWPQYLKNNVVLERPQLPAGDTVAIIQTIDFSSKSGLTPDSYLAIYKNEQQWNAKRQYKAVEGKQFTLILYDPVQKALTATVEIATVMQTHADEDYPWSNIFVPGSWKELNPLIGIEEVRKVPGLQGFKRGQAAYINLTGPQYRALFPPLTGLVAKASAFRGGGSGESDAHKALKHFVLSHPQVVGLPEGTDGKVEYGLPSGDTIVQGSRAMGRS